MCSKMFIIKSSQLLSLFCLVLINHVECSLTILGASYGLTDETGVMSNNIVSDELSISCSNSVLGDGWQGKFKVCTVVYSYDFDENAASGTTFTSYVATVKEGQTLEINSGSEWPKYTNLMPLSNQLTIVGATYGSGTKYFGDVTGLVNSYSNSDSLNIGATNSNFGDRWNGKSKALTVVYIDGSSSNDPRTSIVQEGATLTIYI